MSADSSRESGSSRPQSGTDNRSSRYQRAAERVETTAPRELERQRQADDDRRRQAATERQARQDRGERGRSKIMNDVAALLDGDDSAGGRPSPNGREREQAPPRPDPQKPGRSDGDPATDRPGLELDDEPGEDQAKPKPRKGGKTLADFAAEHELEAKELFGLVVSFEEGGPEPVTIGELKDAFKAGRDLDSERDQFEDWRVGSQNEILQARSEIEATVQELAREVPPEAMARATARARDALAAQVERSKAQLTEWFPEWRDAQVKIRDRESFTKLMATYGFSSAEVGGVLDARLIKFGMDAMRLMDRYKRLREGERERKPSTQPPAKHKPKAVNATDRVKDQVAKGDKVGAVATLLGG